MNTRDTSARFARESKIRFTAYGHAGIPLAHGATKTEAIQRAAKNGRVVAVVKRLRAYPFTHLKTWDL